jgi:hypothetical protein
MRASVAVALLLAAASAFAQGGGPLPDRTPRPRIQWQRFYSDDDRFSVEMPGHPTFKTESLKAKNGHAVQYSSYTIDLGRSAYMVSTSDYDNETKISLDGAIDGVMSSWKDVRNLDRRTTKLYGHAAQIVDFTSEDYHVVVRAFAVGRRLYQLGFVEMRDDYVPAHVDRFMKSFRLR